MKQLFARFGFAIVVALMAGCSHTPAPADSLLAAAGFNVVIATTPEQIKHVATLPPYKMIRVLRDGKESYVYADPARKMLLVGGLFEYDRYRDLCLARNVAAEDLQDAKFNAERAAEWDVW